MPCITESETLLLVDCQKTERYKTCHNRKNKEMFSIRTKFQYYKVF